MRSRYGLILIAGLLAFMLPANAIAQEPFAKVGTFAMQFLKLGVSARATGMGSAFTAIADDATATYWNPGGIVDVTRTEVSLNHTFWPADVSLDYAAAVISLPFLPGAWASTEAEIVTARGIRYLTIFMSKGSLRGQRVGCALGAPGRRTVPIGRDTKAVAPKRASYRSGVSARRHPQGVLYGPPKQPVDSVLSNRRGTHATLVP